MAGKKSFSKGPDRKVNLALGGIPLPKRAPTAKLEPRMGNKPTGFIQTTPKKATAAFMGKAPPPMIGKKPPAMKSKKQFKPAGKKVF